jgi:hypothetical protein
MKLLVGITSYGSAHSAYLDRILAGIALWPFEHRVLVFSNEWKNLGERAITVVKDSRSDPMGLTWAYRERFAQHADDYDFFLYQEDDILISERNVVAWLVANEILGDGASVPAFFRKEIASDGRVSYPDAHSPFGWSGQAWEAAGHRFRRFSNVHAGCCMLSHKQLKMAMASGKYVAGPHDNGPYAVRELACSGAFVECGLSAVLDLTLFDDLTVQHMPANYFGILGTSETDLKRQIAEMV